MRGGKKGKGVMGVFKGMTIVMFLEFKSGKERGWGYVVVGEY